MKVELTQTEIVFAIALYLKQTRGLDVDVVDFGTDDEMHQVAFLNNSADIDELTALACIADAVIHAPLAAEVEP